MKSINRVFITFLMMITFSMIGRISYADGRLERCEPYKEQIISILISEGVNPDYFYLAVCESGCRKVESNKGAVGFFQVTRHTYKHYKPAYCFNKDINDIECNTRASARYIKHLQERFKSMSVLVKAYNRGGTNYLKHGTTQEAEGLSACVMNYVNKSNSD